MMSIFVLLDDGKSKHKMDKTFNELKLRDKITQIKDNYDFLVTLKSYEGHLPIEDIARYEQETYNTIKLIDKRIKPKLFEGIDANLINLDKVLKSFINKYNNDHKDNAKEIEKEISNIYDVVANAESWMERNLNIK